MEISVAFAPMGKHPIGARVAARRREVGVSQQELADAVGMKQASIADIESGKVKRPGKLLEIAQALRTTQGFLLTGHPEPAGDLDATEPPHQLDGIQEIDARAGLGGGGTVDQSLAWHHGSEVDPVKPEAWKFPAVFVRNELRRPEDCIKIIETQGDSMSPTIQSGDRVIIDTDHRVPSPDGLYAIRDRFGSIVVKRLQVLRRGDPPIVKIISDNPHHGEEEVSAEEIETAIIGRVLWGLKRL